MNNIESYNYNLPPELIAQFPASERQASRLLLCGRDNNSLKDAVFSDIVEILSDEYFIVMNNSKVLPARMPAKKAGGGKSELFFLEYGENNTFKALLRGKIKPGEEIFVGGSDVVTAIKHYEDGSWLVRAEVSADALMQKHGRLPLPPYIQREAGADDAERYQTVYAAERGSVAAPTAGLHFTKDILDALHGKGIETVELTLHVGIGTFRPIKTDNLDEHHMHSENYFISSEAAEKINKLKNQGKKLLAIGTTSVRTLESAFTDGGIKAGQGSTELFIRPGYQFKAVDALLTNFHLPKSSLLVLVSAFMGMERRINAYEHAVKEGYRFFSYGDAMLIL